ncbi:MAG: methyl-accepting chemotaxis protein [Leptospiraceae bacterium]|nr:methyl-accepting chemotaxis protein [Leptospiraceae bacterium]MDW7976256.1 methyl-accepting chemotaxis protein [Leptospiraceae bacterium]
MNEIKRLYQYLWEKFLSFPISLLKKLVILIAFLEFGAIVTTGAFVLVYFYFIFEQNIEKRAIEIGKAIEKFAAESLVKNDFFRLQKTAEELSKDPAIRYIIIQDRNGQAVVHSNYHYVGLKFNDQNSTRAFYAEKEFFQNYYSSQGDLYTKEYVIPLMTPIGKVGFIRVGMNYQNLVQKPLIHMVLIILSMTVGFVILGIFIAIPATKLLLIPVNAVHTATKSLAGGDLTTEVKILSKDEIGEMAQAFNKMVQSQEQLVSMIKKVSEEILKTANELASSSEEVSAASSEISKTISEVSKDLKKGTEFTEFVNQKLFSFAQLLENAKKQAEKSYIIAQDTYQISTTGKEKMKSLNEITDKIYHGAETIMNSIKQLNELSKKINNITSTINGITSQITLLSLNASIEAARAGEYGKGFAVVADEISKLADQSSKQAKEITQIINQIIDFSKKSVESTSSQFELVSQGKSTTEIVYQYFEKLILSANNIAEELKIIKEIAQKEVIESQDVIQNLKELKEIIQKTSHSARDVDNSTKETSNAMVAVAKQTQNLNALAIELRKIISNFKLHT